MDIRDYVKNKGKGGSGAEPARTVFTANPLRLTLTDDVTGTVITSQVAEATAFQPKQNAKGKWQNMLGWKIGLSPARDAGPNSEARSDTTGTYCGLPITGQLNLFVGIGKVECDGEEFVLLPRADDSDSDGSESAEE